MRGTGRKIVFGGHEYAVVVGPRTASIAGLSGFVGVLRSIFKGMRLTLSYLVRPSTVVTQQYPENRTTLRLPDRYRSELRLIREESGHHRCPGCKICEKACPNGSIRIMARKGAVSGKTELEQFVWRLDTCTFCYACVQSCPFDAIEFTGNFEGAVFDKRLLVYNLNDYKGPPAKFLATEPDPEKLSALKEPLSLFAGPTPLGGTDLPGNTSRLTTLPGGN